MDTFLLDLRFAARSLRRRPTFAAVAIGTFALSIAAATSVFSIVDGVLFRYLPYRNPERLVAVWQTIPSWRGNPLLSFTWDQVRISYPDFVRWRARQTSFSAVAAWTNQTVMLSAGDRNEQLPATHASPSLFDVLGVKALIGRTFLPGEDVVNGPRVTLVSFDAWQTRFGARRDVVGATVSLDSIPYRIVGVLPRDFTLARGRAPSPFFVPAGQDQGDLNRDNHSYASIARLEPGISIARAQAEAHALLGGATALPPRGIRVLEYRLDQTRAVRAPLLVLLAAVGLLVLLACVNVATLLLGEAASREQEMGARAALGASRGRIVAQLLTESTLLSGLGTAVGVVLAWWMTKGLVALAPPRMPGIAAARVDARVLAVAAAAAAITGLLFGLTPALTLSGTPGAVALRRGGQSSGGRARLQRTLIAAELALCVVLLVGAGLVSRSLGKLAAISPGFPADHLLTVKLAQPRDLFRDAGALHARYAAIVQRLAGVPGVTAVSGASSVPFDESSATSSMILEGEDTTSQSGSKHESQRRIIEPNYFAVLGVPVLAGRVFGANDIDGAPAVVVVSEALARRDWPNASPLGRRVYFSRAWRTVVGIVGDVKFSKLSMDDVETATIYLPFGQRSTSLNLVLRTSRDPSAIVAEVRAALRDVAPAMPVTEAVSMDDRIRSSIGDERFRTLLIDLFGVMAAVLAAAGMYGVTARGVARRTKEVGIRVALGASPGSVIRLIAGSTLAGAVAGAAVGFAASLVASRVLDPCLFGVTTRDPLTYAAIVGLLGVISLTASWIPARRAGRVAPAVVLREE
jgi:putative ABC transport system permease protein